MTKKQLGYLGEDLAEKYLKNKNYLILSKNYTIRGGEIDLVAQDIENLDIVFVEVKTRTSNQFGWPEQAVNYHKKQYLKRTANKYLIENKYSLNQNYRFDILAVELNHQTRLAKISHFINI